MNRHYREDLSILTSRYKTKFFDEIFSSILWIMKTNLDITKI